MDDPTDACRQCYRGSVPTDRDDDTCEACGGSGLAGDARRHTEDRKKTGQAEAWGV